MDEISNEVPPVLLPCSICSRTFRPEVLDRHTRVCEKTASKKRRVFDSFKSRVSGTELEEFLGPAPLPGQAPKRPEKSPVKKVQGPPRWKQTHESLIAVLRAARGAASADPATSVNKNAGNEQCPSCGRFFGPRAFDRHVQFCKEKTARIKMTPSKVSQAQERLEARTKYKAPLSLKPKMTTKEKYSPMLPRKVDSSETCLPVTPAKTPASSGKTVKSPMSIKSNISNFSRQSPIRSSERQRSVSPKKPLVSSKVVKENHPKQPPQPKIKDILKDTEDLRPRTGLKNSVHQDKIRSGIRKIPDSEDETPKLIQNSNYRENRTRKSYLSSDDGNETDTNLSVSSAGRRNQKVVRKQSPERRAVKKRVASMEDTIPSPKDEPSSSRRSKKRMPVINDLSVNDESFGIRVAPCPHQSPREERKLKTKPETPRARKPRIEPKPQLEPRPAVEMVIPSVNRSSKIPKPVVKNSRSDEEGTTVDEDSVDEDSRRDRPSVLKREKFRKWQDISGISTSELIRMTEDFDFVSELDEMQETEGSETEDVSRSTIWEMAGEDTEDLARSDDSLECKADVCEPPSVETKEDEFIVLHVTEPEKLTDDDMNMKMSVSEPCFKTTYPDSVALLESIKKNANVFVFNSSPKYCRKRSAVSRRRRRRRVKEAKVVPRISTIRERTFLANDIPQIKRRKLSGREKSSRTKITNLSDFFFGYVTKLREEHLKLDWNPGDEVKLREEVVKPKRFEYFEIGKDGEEPVKEKPKKKKKKKEVPKCEEEEKKEEVVVMEEEPIPKKLSICYSDEEFEELRRKKEQNLNRNEIKVESEEAPLSIIDSLEAIKSNPLDNIEEEEEPLEDENGRGDIEMEDFMVRKPTAISKSGNCLEKLFPKTRQTVDLKSSESSVAVQLNYVVDSLYDLKQEESLNGKMLRKRLDKGVKLPEIPGKDKRRDRKGNSMSSLVEMWKVRKEHIQNGTLFESTEKARLQKNAAQTALLPLVLRQKLKEVAEQIDKKDENYDPFKQAERQMLTLLSWPSQADLKPDKSQLPYPSNRNLETSPTSAFSRYPAKEEPKNRGLVRRSSQKEYTPMYTAADDWEEIFEKHFDLNRNEMNDKMTRSVKSALDGLLQGSNLEGDVTQRKNLSDNSVLEEIAYTSTPKRSSSRMSNVADSTFDASGRKTPAHRKSSGHGRITPPDDFVDYSKEGRKSNRNSGISLSGLSFCSQASDTTLADEEIMRTNLDAIGKGSTPRTGKRRFARSQSVFDERNKMLFAKTFDHNFSSSDENELLPPMIQDGVQGKKSVLNNPYPKSLPSRFPRSQSVLDGRCRGDGDHSEERDLVSSPEGNKKDRKAKMSGDSAYSSLNRRSPRSGMQTNQQEDRLSSSGSEHSLPPLNNDHPLKQRSLNYENTMTSSKKMSKFCHECGSKYPVAVAKFCCECGMRRLFI